MPTLEITTMIGCPLKCTFCPQDKLTAAYTDPIRTLTFSDFQTILNKIPTYVRIDFSGMAEPWTNRYATQMLEHTLQLGHNVAVYTTLQGMRDYESVITVLTEYRQQVETVVIHLPDISGNMRGFKDADYYREALLAFDNLRTDGVLASLHMMTMNEYNDALVEARPTDMVWSGLTRAGNLDPQQIEGQSVEETPRHNTPVACSFTPFYDHNVLLPNGDVVLCCMDYSKQHVLGNLLRDGYFDLFTSNTMNRLRVENMQYGHSNNSLCKKCSRAKLLTVQQQAKQFWEDVK